MIRLIITGACGRTGSAVLRLAAVDPEFKVTHILEAKDHRLVGTNIALSGIPGVSLPLETDLNTIVEDGDVVIDFTEPAASFLHFKAAAEHGKAIVVGTTGFSTTNAFRDENTARFQGGHLSEHEHWREPALQPCTKGRPRCSGPTTIPR